MISEAVTAPARSEAMMRKISDQWARIRATLMRPAISDAKAAIG
jgi:hypothetical protein